jgi:hypothetical protein
MQALSNSDLLALWERGSGLHRLDQGLLALSAAFPEVPSAILADWPLGRRNRALIELYCACFTAHLQAWASCSHCGEKMEFELEGAALVGNATDQCVSGDANIVVKGHSFRLPTSRDLARAAQEDNPRAAAFCLLERCRTDRGDGEGPLAWPEEDLEAVEEAMALADPLAEIPVSLSCPACESQWNEALDPATFLWVEIETRAKRLLWEMHTLASVYGWTETAILSLSEPRRALYLGMVRA